MWERINYVLLACRAGENTTGRLRYNVSLVKVRSSTSTIISNRFAFDPKGA